MTFPIWLPHIINLTGKWDDLLAMLYSIFDQNFIQSQPRFETRSVRWDTRKLDGKYDEGFWHLVTRNDYSSGEPVRLPDFRRAERLPWCAPVITNSHENVVKVWDYLEGNGRTRSYLWLEQWDYVVILEKRMQQKGEIAFLVTAYHVDGASTRKKLERKYKDRVS